MLNTTGRVTASFLVRMSAYRKSFHEKMKQKIPATNTPGMVTGSTMSRMTRRRVAPSVIAASSISTGMVSMNPFSIQIAKGNTIDRLIHTIPVQVSSRWSCRNIRKNGSTTTMGGTNWVASTPKNSVFLNLIAKREKL